MTLPPSAVLTDLPSPLSPSLYPSAKYAPSVPAVVQLSDRSVKLSWTVHEKGNGQQIKFFKVQYKEMSPQKTEWRTSDPQLPGTTRDFEVAGLKSGRLLYSPEIFLRLTYPVV